MASTCGIAVLGLSLVAGSLPVLAQQAWRDPEQGCWYLVTPQGGIGLRYRSDGSPDCPESRSQSGQAPLRAAVASASAAPLAAGPSAPANSATVSRALTWPGTGARDAAAPTPVAPPAPLSWGGSQGRPDDRSAPATPAARTAVLSMSCFPAEQGVAPGQPTVQRVRVDQRAMLLVMEASVGGANVTERFTIDTNMDTWLGGRNQRDSRLGFVLTQSRGLLRVDWAEGSALKGPVRSFSFRCQGDGGVT